MKRTPAEAISNAVLYEGYLLYPYRDSAIKNQFRWTFGCLFPQGWCREHDPSERDHLHSEILVEGTSGSLIDIGVRFLVLPPDNAGGESRPPVQREVIVTDARVDNGFEKTFFVPAADGDVNASCGDGMQGIKGELRLESTLVRPNLYRLAIEVRNRTPFAGDESTTREAALQRALLSTQIVVSCRGGAFVSLIDPPAALRIAAGECRNDGCWPVMSGTPGTPSSMLIAPIILYDYPQVAAESQGEMFDGTEIDEILTMRIRTLTENEKAEIADADPRASELLQRSDSMPPDELHRMHASMRPTSIHESLLAEEVPAHITVNGILLGKGDQVILCPKGKNDIFDLALAGSIATIETIERDFEGQLFFTVTADLDPGKDFGRQGLPGHRFFFRPDEVKPLASGSAREELS